MMNRIKLHGLKVLGLAGAIVGTAGLANAQVIGSLWENDTTDDASKIPSGTPNVTFTSPVIDFVSGSAYTIGEFLASASSTISTGSSELGNTLDNTHIELKGTVFLPAGANDFDITHDDGVVVSVAPFGTVLSNPGPTIAKTDPFTVTPASSGLYAFTIEYNECCGAPGELTLTDPSGAPVKFVALPDAGATLSLLTLSLTALAAMRKR